MNNESRYFLPLYSQKKSTTLQYFLLLQIFPDIFSANT